VPTPGFQDRGSSQHLEADRCGRLCEDP